MKKALLLLLILLNLGISLQAEETEHRDEYKEPKVVEKLVSRAKEAGISEEALKNLELREQGGEQINLLQYLDEFEGKKRLKELELKEFSEKRFLTVNDIFKELVDHEQVQLIKLREELVSE
ncbi:MAG: hypothetical protein A2527_10050 [Candidatus Lambdaproteobacteria bacterium RIFOXYD2_FULL_50_16]|uniref:Uncharacterized protein n=1 Tax=Candidatus Lambdaproteobacteria bacterium RIFOXYD2_FULL_50_16 TaxID=1817772 RepID=A0A1F6G9X7_9PROT|nr:MAG: hypothetical protein A2527_10050 [Candidatus Lambdaproteobacteria bacterium RIFOXYD2_FULL_50_16]